MHGTRVSVRAIRALKTTLRSNIMWTKPAYQDLRIGFEVTMYFANR